MSVCKVVHTPARRVVARTARAQHICARASHEKFGQTSSLDRRNILRFVVSFSSLISGVQNTHTRSILIKRRQSESGRGPFDDIDGKSKDAGFQGAAQSLNKLIRSGDFYSCICKVSPRRVPFVIL